LIHSESIIPFDKINECKTIGISSGASAPEILVSEFIEDLKKQFTIDIEEIEITKENITFKVPGKLN
jgi:4-hydroxy-3-methylbut-2-enyl diphosphate reductase